MKGLTNETVEALLFTVKSTVECVTFLLQNGFFYVLTRRFSGDPVEAVFSAVRMGGGSNDITDARTAACAIKRMLKSGIMISSKSANVASRNQNYCGDSLPSTSSSAESVDENILPDYVTVLLDRIREPEITVFINLQTATQALVCGYLIRVVDERFSCDICVSNISMSNSSTPLMELIHNQDRGGLRYPKQPFVGLIKHVQEFVEAAVPYFDIGHIRQHICLTWSQATKGNIEGGGFGPVLWIGFGVAQWSERLVRKTKNPAAKPVTVNENSTTSIRVWETCGYNFCPGSQETEINPNLERPPEEDIFTIAGIYLACMVLACLMITFGVNPLKRYNKDGSSSSARVSGSQLLVVTIKLLGNFKLLLLIPLTLWMGIEQVFRGADYTAGIQDCFCLITDSILKYKRSFKFNIGFVKLENML
ncbi:hypothetical protein ANN_13039 [Periplaneta americana]|uniref:Uncharacterized protein n=1 Tax=Periplaneta americana TaxID=6978 RepID=A0ABQ8TKE8_PERAM|nr:hypothetical protein ANN_13039 [Periplaneta americana]